MRLISIARVRYFAALLLIPLFSLGCLAWPALLTISLPAPGGFPDVRGKTPTATYVLPTVGPGGTSVVAKSTYFHTSGLLSLPRVEGWEPSANGAEEKVDPTGSSKLSRAGVTFINSAALSVVHAFVEQDSGYSSMTVEDLDSFFSHDNLQAAWANYTGGWTELDRTTADAVFTANFELSFDGDTYLARMLARMEMGWLVQLRLVVPGNNPDLLDALQAAIWPGYKLWPQAATTPINWSSVVDQTAGYVIKFPTDWQVIAGSAGDPFTVEGLVNDHYVLVTTRGVAGQRITSKDEAAKQVKSAHPTAKNIIAKAMNKSNRYDFLASYSDLDPDGKPGSGITGFVNGKNSTLYMVDMFYSVKGLTLSNELDPKVPAILSQVRGSLFLIAPGADPKAGVVASPTPTATATKARK